MRLNDYQGLARKTALYPMEQGLTYTALGLCGESGEVAEKIKKFIRGDEVVSGSSLKEDLLLELGDVLWYLSNLAFECGYTLQAVAEANIEKLDNRKKNNTIKGSGDER